MIITRIIYRIGAVGDNVLQKLHEELQSIVAAELSDSDFELQQGSVDLIFEQGHKFNRGKDLIIIVEGNGFPETENIEEKAERIAKRVQRIIYSLYDHPHGSKLGFVIITQPAGGLGNFRF